MSPAIIADTGGLLRALARTAKGRASFPEYEEALISASAVIVPGLVLAEIDYFLRENRAAMRKLVAEIFDPATRYQYEPPLPSDIARSLELDARFGSLNLGLVDGTVAAIAERRQIFRILSTDRRHLGETSFSEQSQRCDFKVSWRKSSSMSEGRRSRQSLQEGRAKRFGLRRMLAPLPWLKQPRS